jgi:two-component system cell cycle response regulator CtrA
MHGYDVLQQLRDAGVNTPVLIPSGLGELDDKIKGPASAPTATDKAVRDRELVARIRAIVRRSKGLSQSTVRTGKLLVNLDSRTVMMGDQPGPPDQKEYSLLSC